MNEYEVMELENLLAMGYDIPFEDLCEVYGVDPEELEED